PLGDGTYRYDIVCPDRTICGCRLGVGGRVNVENSLAAVAAIWAAGEFSEEGLRQAMDSFGGVKRRFEVYINTPQVVYIDDYAHHPEELRAAIGSIRGMFPERRLTVAFQPHLYTRTRDFYEEFADALSMADEVLLLPIYPARELPIEGVESEMIGRLVRVPWRIVEKSHLAEELGRIGGGVIVTFGAGDIDRECDKIATILGKE
ncbi:MAG: UDP-N-acetylmuramate--L-alanine ligase, partial [Tidjanibacter sp.]|nr:UDP-N-acetylmuramate--L-alanine ligase [Tidjanibacter sp.]